MANHANIINCKEKFDMKKLGVLIKKFIDEKLQGVLQLDKGEVWLVHLEGEKYDGIQVCVETYKGKKYIDIRHGHGNSFWWWVDFYLEHYLATELKGKVRDDADYVVEKPNVKRYEDFDKFRRSNGCHFDLGISEYLEWYPVLKVLTKHPKPFKGTLKLIKRGEEMVRAMEIEKTAKDMGIDIRSK